MTIDNLFEEFDKFELEGAEKLTPREFARYYGISPQMVYYFLRNGIIQTQACLCGRKVVDVVDTKRILDERKQH